MQDTSARQFVSLVQTAGTSSLVTNLETEMMISRVGDFEVPTTINDGRRPTCYICCPSTAYLEYGQFELSQVTRNPLLRALGSGALRAASPVVRAMQLGRQIQLNNWLVSTNILPPVGPEAWLDAFDAASDSNPSFVPVLRSVNDAAHGPLIEAFDREGLTLLPVRKIFFRTYPEDWHRTRDDQQDVRLRSKGRFFERAGTTFGESDFDQAARLYRMLYIEKYSRLNPQYTGRFFEEFQNRCGFELTGLFDPECGGRMVGVLGQFDQHGTIVSPVVGYDTDLPQKLGLYRWLVSLSDATARSRQRFANWSAGAEQFKRNRGAQPAIEYLVADLRRASRSQRRAGRILSRVLQLAARAAMRL